MGIGFPRRGDIVRVNFAKTEGRPIQKTRPALVVQNDMGNRHSPKTVVAAIHHDAQKMLPVQVSVPGGTSGLTKDSVIDCGVLATVDQQLLEKPIGRLSPAYMNQVDKALKISLGLL